MSSDDALDVKVRNLELEDFVSAASDCNSFSHKISSRSLSSSRVRGRF